MAKLTPKFSALIPSYKRYGRLERLIVYLQKTYSDWNYRHLLENFEFLISDGSPVCFDPEGRSRLQRLINSVQSEININFSCQPEASMISRQKWLFQNASADNLFFLGDEDLPNLNFYLEALTHFNKETSIAAVGGVYADIKGFRRGSIFFCLQEGWVDSVLINSTNPLMRLAQYCYQYSLGLHSVYYALMRREAVSKYLELVCPIQDKISLNDCELIMQTAIFLTGGALFLPNIHLFRDYTMVGHNSSDHSVNWKSEQGKDFCRKHLATHLYTLGYFQSRQESLIYIQDLELNVIDNGSPRGDIQYLVDQCQSQTNKILMKKIESRLVQILQSTWRETLSTCYQKSDYVALGAGSRREKISQILYNFKSSLSKICAF